MQTYYMFGKYSPDALKNISAGRTEECVRIIKELGGEVILMNALLGEQDLVFIINFANNQSALKASLSLNKLTGITFKTCPAITVTEFDALMSQM